MNDPSFRGNGNLDANVDVSADFDVDVGRGTGRGDTDEYVHVHENEYVRSAGGFDCISPDGLSHRAAFAIKSERWRN